LRSAPSNFNIFSLVLALVRDEVDVADGLGLADLVIKIRVAQSQCHVRVRSFAAEQDWAWIALIADPAAASGDGLRGEKEGACADRIWAWTASSPLPEAGREAAEPELPSNGTAALARLTAVRMSSASSSPMRRS
jgi:hypothetical protein